MSKPLITLDCVSFGYGNIPVLEDVHLCIDQGEFLGIVGPNGSGKSTLLKLILGLLKPQHGSIVVMGGKPKDASNLLGYVPQFIPFDRTFPITVLEMVMMGRLGKTRSIGGYLNVDREIALRSLRETETEALADRTMSELSGGQLQRVLIARALATEPEILIMDEPTANIDPAGERGVFELLKRLNQKVTVLVVSHDIAFVSRYVTRVACVNRQVICHQASAITPELIEQLYGGHVHMVHHHHVLEHEEH